MKEKILLISDKKDDLHLFSSLLRSDQLPISQTSLIHGLEKWILKNGFHLILADYDYIREKASIFYRFQKGLSRSCIIFYGEDFGVEETSQILQKGIYRIIPRSLLSERIFDAVVSGLENRKTFIEILRMMDELKEVNRKLEREKEILGKRNQEIGFINLLSQEISYDLDWNSILPRMIDAGLEETLDYSIFGLFYKLGSKWHLTVRAVNIAKRQEKILKSKIVAMLFDKKTAPEYEIDFQIVHSKKKGHEPSIHSFEDLRVFPLSLAGKRLGAVFIIPKKRLVHGDGTEELMNTLANILALSLKNAQEYHKLREAAVTDNLTGIYNRKGLNDFLKKEFYRAKRYDKALSFVMVDMNDFKSINDSLGHQAGDYALRELAVTFKESIRQPDILSRYGGDEFAILLPETTIEEADVIMKRLSRKIESHTFEWGSDKIKTGISYGISNIRELKEGEDIEDLIQLADSRLYESKIT